MITLAEYAIQIKMESYVTQNNNFSSLAFFNVVDKHKTCKS